MKYKSKSRLSLRKHSSKSFDREDNLSRSTENEGNSSDGMVVAAGKRHNRAHSVNESETSKRLQASYTALSNDYRQLQTRNSELEYRIRELEMGGAALGTSEPTETNDEQISRQLEIDVLTRLKKEVNSLTKQLLLSDLDGETLSTQVSKYLQDLQMRNEFLEAKVDKLEDTRIQIVSKNQRQDNDLNQMSMQLMKLTKEKKTAEKKLLSMTADHAHLNELVRDLRNEIERLNLFGADLPKVPDVQYKTSSPLVRNNSFHMKSGMRKPAAAHGRAKSYERRKRSNDAGSPATSPPLLQGRHSSVPSPPSNLEDDEFGSVKDYLMNDPEWTETGLWGVKIETQVNARSEIRVIKHWKFTTSDGSAHQVQLMHVQDRFRTDSMREIIIDNMPQYRKKSNAGNFHFKINNDDVVLTVQTLANGWTYELILNGSLFRTAREMVEAIV